MNTYPFAKTQIKDAPFPAATRSSRMTKQASGWESALLQRNVPMSILTWPF